MTYLTVTIALLVAALLGRVGATDLDAGFREGLMLALIALTLPVSAAYFIIGLFDSTGTAAGVLSPMAVLYSLGYVLLAVVNAAVFRRLILSARKRTQDRAVRIRGVNHHVWNLWWTVPLAVLLSLPQWFVASFAWCGISGCSGGGFGVSTGTEWLAVSLSVVNGLILAVAVFAVRWLHPAGRRALVAVAAGAVFALVGAAITHG